LEKITVNYTNFVQDFFDELITTLFSKEYFSYEENAIAYVQKLVFYIEENIDGLPHKKSPNSLLKYGDFYVFYKSDSRTPWYIFFSKKEKNYLIKYLTNNHIFEANFLNILQSNE
jgi:bifunctional pyridoxal-dependent enzyme with beta-cystathionase and maltose regulon repressor activities